MRKRLSNGLAAALLGGGLAGCASWTPLFGASAHEHLEFLVNAADASPVAREGMWQAAAADGAAPESRLRRALLLSISGSARYNPAKAESELRSLLAEKPATAVAAVARVRLDSLQSHGECHEQVEVLKKRLSKVVEIERGAKPSVSGKPGSSE